MTEKHDEGLATRFPSFVGGLADATPRPTQNQNQMKNQNQTCCCQPYRYADEVMNPD